MAEYYEFEDEILRKLKSRFTIVSFEFVTDAYYSYITLNFENGFCMKIYREPLAIAYKEGRDIKGLVDELECYIKEVWTRKITRRE